MAVSAWKQSQEKPTTFTQLIRKAGPILWGEKNPKYYKYAMSNMEDADEIMGRPLLKDMNTELIDDFIKIVSSGVKPSTSNRKLSNVHMLLKFAHQRQWIDHMPVFRWRREENGRIRWLSIEEEKQLLSLLPPKISAFCEVLIHTGMRRGELMSMEREQLDGNYVRLWKTKTHKARSVPLSDRAKELLEEHLPFNLHWMQIWRAWQTARKAMGLENDPDFVLHMLRHTAATRTLDTTQRIEVVQKLLGHSRITTTQRYAHVADDVLLDAVRLTSKKYELTP